MRTLNTERRFSETLQFFKEQKANFSTAQIGLNKYVVYEVILALIESNHYEAIFMFIDQYSVVLNPKDFSYLLKKIKDKPSVHWNIVNRFCDLVAHDQLNTECKIIEVERKGAKKSMELASDKENWFAFKSKALFETEQYQACFDISKQALEVLDKFHYSNDVWFARRLALAKRYLGHTEEALNELLKILNKKKEWFIQHEIAEIYKELGDVERALKYAVAAMNNFGNLEFKVGVLVLVGELLEQRQEKSLAWKHYMLSKLLRQQAAWKMPQSLDDALQRVEFEQITIMQLPDLIKELKIYWSGFKQNASKTKANHVYQGKIFKILHHNEKGIDGFIKYDQNKSIYFNLPPTDERMQNIEIGSDVAFCILPPNEHVQKERAIKLKF
ncbi:MAG: hypothetical protein LC107_08240 [Chitinophagales bacterium]|nr:hypothetical protein [Chitinophagales bacterium]